MHSSVFYRYFCFVAAGLVCAATATAQVTYTIEDKIEVLDDTFYSRPDHADPTFGSVSNDGTRVAFLAFDRASQDFDLYVVEIADPDSFLFIHSLENLPGGGSATPNPFFWSPDDSTVVIDEYRIDLTTVNVTVVDTLPVDLGNGPEDRTVDKVTFTRQPSGNLGFGRLSIPEFNVWPLGVATINPLGNVTPQPPGIGGFFTNIPGFRATYLNASHDGDRLAFMDGASNTGTVYVLHDIRAITQSGLDQDNVFFNTTVTDLGDSRLVQIQIESGLPGVLPIFSSSGEFVFFTADYNDFFYNNEQLPFEEAIDGSDFDIVIARADGQPIDGQNEATGLYRIAEPGTQLITSVSTGGNLVVVGEKTGVLEEPFRLFLARVAVNETLTGDDLSGQTVEVDVDGTPTMVTLSDNAVQLASGSGGALIEDGAGTTATLPEGQIVEFPDGTTDTTITIKSTSDTYSDAQLPPDAPANSLAVAREFSPSGTNFYPPIEITYTYTDDDVEGLDESTLSVYVFNEGTMMFEALPDSDIISREPGQNRITFQVDHFSTYALAGGMLSLPMREAALLLMFAFVAVAAGFALRPLPFGRRNRQR